MSAWTINELQSDDKSVIVGNSVSKIVRVSHLLLVAPTRWRSRVLFPLTPWMHGKTSACIHRLHLRCLANCLYSLHRAFRVSVIIVVFFFFQKKKTYQSSSISHFHCITTAPKDFWAFVHCISTACFYNIKTTSTLTWYLVSIRSTTLYSNQQNQT